MKYPKKWSDYELLDFGDERKLERFGDFIFNRPEPAANSSKSLSKSDWDKASYYFVEEKGQAGFWKSTSNQPEKWNISYPFINTDIQFGLQFTRFKHLGIFPEQADNWEFISRKCDELHKKKVTPKVLNLFAYTGGASLAASLCGAEVTHVDSVRGVVQWGKENAALNSISNIRWIVEDARTFVEKSIRRGDVYHGIIVDPPIFGLAGKGKPWKLNKDLPDLLAQTMKIIHPKLRFFILNTYSPQLPMKKLEEILQSTAAFPSNYESDMLGIKSTSAKLLPLGNLIRF